MGKTISKTNCCLIDQMSSNLTLSAEAERLSHSMDDEPILNSSLDESRGEPPTLSISLKLSSNYIQLSTEHQEWPVCLNIRCSDQVLEERIGMDIVILLEASNCTSEKCEIIKSSIEFVISRLTGQDRLSIVSYNDTARRLCPLISMSYTGKIKIAMALRNLVYYGSSDLAEGMIFALSVLNNRRNVNTNSNIILLSSGRDNCPSSITERISDIIREFSARITGKFSIHSFALAKPTAVLAYISEETNGTCYFPNDEAEHFQGLAHCCGVMESKVAEELNVILVHVESPIPLVISKVYSENSETQFRMPEILAGTTMDTIFIVKFLPHTGGDYKSLEILRVVVEYKVRGNKFVEQVSLRIPVVSEDKICKEVELDEDILVSFYRVKAADIMNEAAEICNFDRLGARELLGKGIEELEECYVSKNRVIQRIRDEMRNIKENLSSAEEFKIFVRNRARNHWGRRCFDVEEYHNSAIAINKSRLKALLKLR